MMRLRRAAVMTAMSLLVWTTTASADCAWVLWLFIDPSKGVRRWERAAVVEKRVDCRKELESNFQFWLKSQKDNGVSRMGDRIYVERFADSSLTISAECLPETMDPRGK
jgi:hypothetical protein